MKINAPTKITDGDIYLPWRRGIGNRCDRIYDARGYLVAESLPPTVGSYIVNLVNQQGTNR